MIGTFCATLPAQQLLVTCTATPCTSTPSNRKILVLKSGADLGRGRGVGRPPSGIRPPADPKDPPLNYFEISFLVTDPKIFLKAPLAPIHTYFEGGARAKKAQFFFSQNFPKSA